MISAMKRMTHMTNDEIKDKILSEFLESKDFKLRCDQFVDELKNDMNLTFKWFHEFALKWHLNKDKPLEIDLSELSALYVKAIGSVKSSLVMAHFASLLKALESEKDTLRASQPWLSRGEDECNG